MKLWGCVIGAWVLIWTAGCGSSIRKDVKSQQPPMVEDIREHREHSPTMEPKIVQNLVMANVKSDQVGVALASDRVQGEITFRKEHILNRLFLYGFDLQYSSAPDPEYDLISQSLVIGHVPARFSVFSNTLRLVSDTSHLFESNINHPEVLIAEFDIIRVDSETLTVSFKRPGQLLHKTMNGGDSAPPADSWIRSISYVEDGNYLMFESAVMTADGLVQTFMESVFPRETLVPEGYVGVEDNFESNPNANRFMFISNEPVFVERGMTNGVPKREKTSFANRFHLKTETSTIDWYVTANAPDQWMPEIKSGVEGWNRYFREQKGRDIVRFLGRLPDGIKLGDPRYNVINFDSVANAGAAYESQASDPLTGIQSHSLVYMPYAWYNIAAGLSEGRNIPEPLSAKAIQPKGSEVLFGSSRSVVRCARDAREAHFLLPSGDDGSDSAQTAVDQFGRRVFISTLLHEIGHGLGLGHNFKGSLSFDGSRPRDAASNPTTYSVMDYNYYQHEQDLVDQIGTGEGPQLEYDRQIISYLYNDGRNIRESDPVVAACDDDLADQIEGGVDPSCIRYDAESSPYIGLLHAMGRYQDLSGARGIERLTLSQAIYAQTDRIAAKLSDASTIKNAADARTYITERSAAVGRLILYYLSSGAQSLRVNIANNSVQVRSWRSSNLSVERESEQRRGYVNLLTSVAAMSEAPKSVKDAVNGAADVVAALIQSTDRFGSPEERRVLAAELSQLILTESESAVKKGLSLTRRSIASSLAAGDDRASFASFAIDGRSVESVAVDLLLSLAAKDLTASSLGGSDAASARVAAVTSLTSFLELGSDYSNDISVLRARLIVIRDAARASARQDVVNHVRELLAKL